eukprot:scaffold1748_cov258-Pinguiococcus_pyrenoidosus.AAC.13
MQTGRVRFKRERDERRAEEGARGGNGLARASWPSPVGYWRRQGPAPRSSPPASPLRRHCHSWQGCEGAHSSDPGFPCRAPARRGSSWR